MFGHRNARTAMVVVAVFCAALCAVVHDVSACGGCFSPPGRSLVLQDSERILFQRDVVGKKTRVWIEIKYNGPPSQFGWVLPLPKMPGKIGVGTSYVFDRLDQATAPRFVTKSGNALENCHSASHGGGGCGLAMASSDEATGGRAFSAPQSAGVNEDGTAKVKVIDVGQVGPYNPQKIASNDAQALLDWLNANGYDTPQTALPIIKAHVAKGDVFLALKLASGAQIREIRPITLELDDADPCVPLRLTSIAAVEDLSVIVYLLGPGRAIPKNHMHVVVNPLRLRWDGGVNNYSQVLSKAIDEAAGRAFATEFAGSAKELRVPAPVIDFNVDATGLFNQPIASTQTQSQAAVARSAWRSGELFDKKLLDATALQSVTTVSALISALRASPMILVQDSAAVLEKRTANAAARMGRAADVTAFWSEVALGSANVSTAIAAESVDGALIFKELKEGIIDPVYDVAGMLTASGTVTRLALRISPQEMDRDPLFAFNKDLPDVANLHTAELSGVCPAGDFQITAARLKVEGGHSYIVQGKARQLDFSTPANNTRTGLTVSTADDARWRDAPAALRIEVLDESGAARTVPKAMIDKVDGLIAGSIPGAPTLPAGTALDQVEVRWTPPANDVSAGVTAGAEAVRPEADGCSLGGRKGGPVGLFVLTMLCLLTVLVTRRWSRENAE